MFSGSDYVYVKAKRQQAKKEEEKDKRQYSDDDESISDDELELGVNQAYLKEEAKQAQQRADPPPRPAEGGGFLGAVSSLFSRKEAASASSSAPALSSASIAPNAAPAPPPAPAAARAAPVSHKPHKKWRKADTNVIALRLGTLVERQAVATGDPVFCTQCKAAFSAISKLDDKKWACEFCGGQNTVDLASEELPKQDAVDYMLEAPKVPAAAVASGDSSLVVFCIDISGSMCVTSEVEGSVSLKGDRNAELQKLNTERTNQRLPNQKRNVTYISRLQAVQAAVDSQLQTLSKSSPQRRVAIVTFNGDVTVIGDGTQTPVVITGDKLYNYDELLASGVRCLNVASQPIQKTREQLSVKLFGLEETGPTALGPAVTVAISLAAAAPGSSVVLCTDGKSNVGLGALDVAGAAQESAEQHYRSLGDYAKLKGVTVNVVSLQGDDCRLEALGILSDATGGRIDIVNPLTVAKEFSNVVAQQLIATHAQVAFILHKSLYVREEGNVAVSASQVESKGLHRVLRDVGNVTVDTELNFEYGVASADGIEEGLALPFQAQITYTKLDGSKYMRVQSRSLRTTQERQKAEQSANVDVLSTWAVQKGAKVAQDGDYGNARLELNTHARLLSRAAASDDKKKEKVKHFVGMTDKLDAQLRQAQTDERKKESANYSDEEEQETDQVRKVEIKKKKAMSRKAARSDTTSNVLYQMKNANQGYMNNVDM